MIPPDGHSDHELPRYCMGNIVSPCDIFVSLGRGILYFGGTAVVEGFQPIRSSVRPRLRPRADSMSILDLGQK